MAKPNMSAPLGSGGRFAAVAKAAGGGKKGAAIAAAAGRKKYGKKKFQAMAASGRRASIKSSLQSGKKIMGYGK